MQFRGRLVTLAVERKQPNMHRTEYLNMTETKNGERESLQIKNVQEGKVSSIYTSGRDGISKSALCVDGESLVESYNGSRLAASYPPRLVHGWNKEMKLQEGDDTERQTRRHPV